MVSENALLSNKDTYVSNTVSGRTIDNSRILKPNNNTYGQWYLLWITIIKI